MKKIKLLTSLAGLSTISMGLVPAIASCGCSSTEYNKVVLDETCNANREVGFNASYVLFKFKQENLKEHESTKVKLVNLVVNGAEVTPVAGLLKSQVDSAGNIAVSFNISIAAKHYSTDQVTFDLLFTNEKAGTSYTITGFSIKQLDTVELTSFDFYDTYQVYWQQYINRYKKAGKGDYSSFTFGGEDYFINSAISENKIYFSEVTDLTLTLEYNDMSRYFQDSWPDITCRAIATGNTSVSGTPKYFSFSVDGGLGLQNNYNCYMNLIKKVESTIKNDGLTPNYKYYAKEDCIGIQIYGSDTLYLEQTINTNFYITYQYSLISAGIGSGWAIYPSVCHVSYTE